MKTTLLRSAACFAFVGGMLAHVGVANAVELRVAHASNPGQSSYIFFDELAKIVNAKDVDLTLKVFPSGQLGGDEEVQRSLKSGTVHMGSIAASNLSIVTDAYSWGDLPYVFKSADSAQKVFTDEVVAASIDEKMRQDANTVVLGNIEVGGFRLLINTKRELRTPADVGGMKFRMLANPIDQALLSAWGAAPVAMPWSEVFVSVEQGIVDGLQLQPQAIVSFGFDKMIRYGTYTDTLMTVHVAQANADIWDSLTDEQRQVVREAADEALKIANEADRADVAKYLEQLSGKMSFYRPTAEELERWRELALSVRDQFAADLDADLLARIEEVQK